MQVEKILAEMAARGRPLKVLETRRSQERQDALYKQGRDCPGPIVTKTKSSNHKSGEAVDLWPVGLGFGAGDQTKARVILAEASAWGKANVGVHAPITWDAGHFEWVS